MHTFIQIQADRVESLINVNSLPTRLLGSVLPLLKREYHLSGFYPKISCTATLPKWMKYHKDSRICHCDPALLGQHLPRNTEDMDSKPGIGGYIVS